MAYSTPPRRDPDRDPNRHSPLIEALAAVIIATPVLSAAAFLCTLAAVLGFRLGWYL